MFLLRFLIVLLIPLFFFSDASAKKEHKEHKEHKADHKKHHKKDKKDRHKTHHHKEEHEHNGLEFNPWEYHRKPLPAAEGFDKVTFHSIDHLKVQGQKFDPVALTQLGILFINGKFGNYTEEQDIDKGKMYLEQACAQGYAPAMVALGDLHKTELLAKIDYKKSLEIYSIASKYGYAPAYVKAAEVLNILNDKMHDDIYQNDKLFFSEMFLSMALKDKAHHFSPEVKKKIEELKDKVEVKMQSPEQRFALQKLGYWSWVDDAEPLKPSDYSLSYMDHLWPEGAKFYLEHMAKMGDPGALYRLGNILENGWGWIDEDPESAKNYYIQAAHKKFSPAYMKLAIILEKNGDLNGSFKWCRKAAHKAIPEALFKTSLKFWMGQGTKKSPIKAFYYMGLAQGMGWRHGDGQKNTALWLDEMGKALSESDRQKAFEKIRKKQEKFRAKGLAK